MAESRVNPQNFYVVQGWMVSDLGLKGNELAVYAIIYGFSQADGEWFSGSLNYLTDWTNLSKQSIINVLKSLVKNDLIEKREQIIHGVKFCSYRSKKLTGGSQKTLPPVVKKVDHGSQKTLTGVVKKVDWGSQKTLPNNITDKIEDTIADTDRETEQSPVLSAANGISSIFCTAFGVETISKRLLTSMEQTLQAGVPEQRIASMIHSARNKHPREPESYIAAGLKKLRESAPEDQPVSIKPENQPLEPWEQDWLKEFQAMTEKESTINALANWHTI